MSIDLGETLVRITPPLPPVFSIAPPEPSEVLVVPTPGPRGAPGASGGVVAPYHQASPAASWTWVHNLGRKPPIVILLDDEPDTPVWADVTYIDDNVLNVEFPSPTTGYLHV